MLLLALVALDFHATRGLINLHVNPIDCMQLIFVFNILWHALRLPEEGLVVFVSLAQVPDSHYCPLCGDIKHAGTESEGKGKGKRQGRGERYSFSWECSKYRWDGLPCEHTPNEGVVVVVQKPLKERGKALGCGREREGKGQGEEEEEEELVDEEGGRNEVVS